MKTILTFNAGSSSIKYSAFNAENEKLTLAFKGLVEGIGEPTGIWQHHQSKQTITFHDHQQAFNHIIDTILKDGGSNIIAVAHRVVHGGNKFTRPTRLDADVISEIEALSPLAPLHNPANIMGIKGAQAVLDACPHFAIFDTAFHTTMPLKASSYALDCRLAKKFDLKRYGFHGINHQYVAKQAANFLSKPLAQCQLITLHLGNGASACLIKAGQSHDTSMGFTPLPGLMMGTRCGDIDPSIIFYLNQQGMSVAEINQSLNRDSGLKGIGGDNDMRRLLAQSKQGNQQATLAIEMFVYQIQKYIAAYAGQCSQLDGVVFTGGIGEHAAEIRSLIVKPLKPIHLSINETLNKEGVSSHVKAIHDGSIPILIIPGNEEKAMAEECLKIISI